MMKLAIVGSRTYTDADALKRTLVHFCFNHNLSHGDFIVISGGAKGADSIAEEWAKENKVKTVIHLPQWEKYGKKAGFIRNKLIVDDCDYLICFWDGKSKGCMHSVKLAKAQNKPTTVFTDD